MSARLLTVHEAADLLRIPAESVRVMARRREITSTRVGNGRTAAYRFPETAIDEYLAKRTTPAKGARAS